jgi:hypothetical protein
MYHAKGLVQRADVSWLITKVADHQKGDHDNPRPRADLLAGAARPPRLGRGRRAGTWTGSSWAWRHSRPSPPSCTTWVIGALSFFSLFLFYFIILYFILFSYCLEPWSERTVMMSDALPDCGVGTGGRCPLHCGACDPGGMIGHPAPAVEVDKPPGRSPPFQPSPHLKHVHAASSRRP